MSKSDGGVRFLFCYMLMECYQLKYG